MTKNTIPFTKISIRPIVESDNAIMASIVRDVLTEYDAAKPGFACQDPELNNLHRAYDSTGIQYWVVECDQRVVGGCGIGQLSPKPVNDVCELQKMYLLPAYRGFGIGEQLITRAIEFASDHYHWCYLETLHTMHLAEKLYRQMGFVRIPAPIIKTEHNGCDRWFIKELING